MAQRALSQAASMALWSPIPRGGDLHRSAAEAGQRPLDRCQGVDTITRNLGAVNGQMRSRNLVDLLRAS